MQVNTLACSFLGVALIIFSGKPQDLGWTPGKAFSSCPHPLWHDVGLWQLGAAWLILPE